MIETTVIPSDPRRRPEERSDEGDLQFRPPEPKEPRYFFIRRPIFGAVISIVITLLGLA